MEIINLLMAVCVLAVFLAFVVVSKVNQKTRVKRLRRLGNGSHVAGSGGDGFGVLAGSSDAGSCSDGGSGGGDC